MGGAVQSRWPKVLTVKFNLFNAVNAVLSTVLSSGQCPQRYIRNGSWMPVSNMGIGDDVRGEVSLHFRKKRTFVSFMKSDVLMGA